MSVRRWGIGIAGLIAICFGWVGLYVGRNQFSAREIRQLVSAAYDRQRPGGGRLSGASYAPPGTAPASASELGRAQLLLLRRAASQDDWRLQGSVYLAAGEWQKFVDVALWPGNRSSADAASLNNVGASYLALSRDDASLLLKAAEAFERAAELDPKAPEPLFNLVVVYRQLRFTRLAEDYFRRYSALDSGSRWHEELTNAKSDEAGVVESLERAVETRNFVEAQRLFQTNPELCRRIVMQHALNNQPESQNLLNFIADEMQRAYGDETPAAMLAPLSTSNRDVIVRIRDLVNAGASLFQAGKYPESLTAYDEAARLARSTRSQFDSLWIDLNRVNTEVRIGRFQAAAATLDRLVRVATEQRFIWLKARALLLYAATWKLTATYAEMLELLTEADREFIRIEAPYDRIRILYYLSAYRYQAGDQDQALKLALECLRLLDDGDAFRTSALDSLISIILYRAGRLETSLRFAKESVDHTTPGDYANGMELQAPIMLAELYQSMSEHQLAEQYIKMAEDALPDAPQSDRVRFEMMLGTLKAKARIKQHDYTSAESLLQKNVRLYSQQPFAAGTALLSPSLVLLAQLYADTGRTTQAAEKFADAIRVVERDDEYLKAEALRVKFDDERRNLYDSAIDFELNSGSLEAAYDYLQRYRAKLFLEFLAAFNPALEPAGMHPDRAAIQRRIGKETQVVEYALLKDRLLIWVVKDDLFTMRSVRVSRSELENKVQSVLRKLRNEDEDAEQLLSDLGKILIDPVGDILDESRTLTIIPDRALHGLPFAALKQSADRRYLIQDFAILVSPSLTHFLTGRSVQPSREAIIGFGSQNGGSAERRELASLGRMYANAATFTGKQVSKASFLERLQNASVFHFAGHSATDAADPLRSAILLDGDRSGPNSVTAVDISQHRIRDNAVVILSSCDSSVGNSRDGVGVRGLTSAFLIAGAGSVVGSLWPVEASSTSQLMIHFHQAFGKAGVPVAMALREAQLEFMNAFPQRAHPYYWSGFVVTGNFSALR